MRCFVLNSTKRDKILAFFLLGTALFNILDYFLTLYALKHGCTEWNPIMKPIVHTIYLPIIKLLLIPTILAAIWFMRAKAGHRLKYYSGSLFSVYLLLILYFGYILYKVNS